VGASGESSLFVFTDRTQGYVSVCVPKENAENGTHIMSALETMEYLQCDENICFSDYNIPAEDDRLKIAQNRYNSHVAHYLLRTDSSKQSQKALDVIKVLRNNPNVTTESKRILKNVEHAVRHKDAFTIKMVMRYDTGQTSLFGLNDDINAMLRASFANVATKATEKRGESRVALFEMR
jgi:hypothetical protein